MILFEGGTVNYALFGIKSLAKTRTLPKSRTHSNVLVGFLMVNG